MGNPDTGADEGPRSPTGRIRMGQGVTDSGDMEDDVYGGEGATRNAGIGRYLQDYADGADDTGWGDASGENAPAAPQIDLALPITAADDQGWGNLNNPRAVNGLTQSLLLAAARANRANLSGGLVSAMRANGCLRAE